MSTYSKRRGYLSGFTLPEVMVTIALLALTMIGFTAVYLFCIKMNYITMVKLGASDQARVLVSRLLSEIRIAGDVKVGMGNATDFQEASVGSPFRGNALIIYPDKTATNVWVKYYWDSNSFQIKQVSSGNLIPQVVADGITNKYVFSIEDFNGQVITNYSSKRVVGVTLQFYKLLFPSAPIGEGALFDFYQVRTRIARRTVE